MFVVVVIVLSSVLSFDSAMCVCGVGGIEARAHLVFDDVIRASWIQMQNVKKCKH